MGPGGGDEFALGLQFGKTGFPGPLGFLREGTESGAIPRHAEEMARNVLLLRSIPVERCMVAWKDVARLDAAASRAAGYATVAASVHTRIPVVVCGMPEAEHVLRAEHTERRFKERILLRCFTWR